MNGSLERKTIVIAGFGLLGRTRFSAEVYWLLSMNTQPIRRMESLRSYSVSYTR